MIAAEVHGRVAPPIPFHDVEQPPGDVLAIGSRPLVQRLSIAAVWVRSSSGRRHPGVGGAKRTAAVRNAVAIHDGLRRSPRAFGQFVWPAPPRNFER